MSRRLTSAGHLCPGLIAHSAILKGGLIQSPYATHPRDWDIFICALMQASLQRLKMKMSHRLSSAGHLCPGLDSNQHALYEHHHLKVACLPVSTPGQHFRNGTQISIHSLLLPNTFFITVAKSSGR